MKKLVLYMNGKKKDIVRLDFVFRSMVHERQLIQHAVDQLKLEYRLDKENDWQIYMVCDSKMNLQNVTL